jgi:1-deoxy-D-xylulose-5-phosphate synthase
MAEKAYKYLSRVDSPDDLKRLSLDELRCYCEELRHYILECCSVNPGHLGSSLGAIELTVALHYVYDTPNDRIVWDVGHQAYAHKIITGRREAFLKNRMQGGISGFPRMAESPYDAFGAGHSSVSISAAFGMAKAVEMSGGSDHVVAVIGDGAMTGGLAFFVVTFTVYFFNLDMKLTSMIEPLLLKWYDRIPRNQHL